MTMETGNGKKKTNAPPLRFPGFEGEWEERNLSDFVTENKERNIKGYFDKTNVLSVSGDYGIVNQIELLGRSFAGTRVSQYRVVRHGNIVYTKSPLKEYPYGIVKANMGDDGIVSTLYAVYKVNGNADEKFIQYYFSLSSRINKYFKPIVRIGAKHDMKIGNQEVLANRVVFPSLSEQRKIADFLRLLDERIAAQRVLIGEMGRLKSAMIETHYVKSHRQKVRFADLGEPFNVGNISKSELSGNGIPCILYGELFTAYGAVISDVVSHTKKSEGVTLSKKGDLVFPSSTTVDAVSLISPSAISIDGVALGGDMFGIHTNPNFDPQYLSYYFNYIAKRKVAKYAKGSTIIHLHWGDIEDVMLELPILNEQRSIALLLNCLEEKTRLERTYLDVLVLQKQYLLRKMFI